MNNTQTIYIYNGVDAVPMNVTHVRVDPSVTIIPNGAFAARYQLVEVELPEGLISIENDAFHNCQSLMRINLPSTVEEIGNSAFKRCDKLDGIVLPEGLQRLGRYVFNLCKSLKTINIPPVIEVLEDGVFLSCHSLTGITFTEGLLEIGEDAFSFCTSLVSVTLPSSLKVIGYMAFDGCKVLDEVHMPDTIESIDKAAFMRCNFTNFRMPPLVQTFHEGAVTSNACLVSLELPENVSSRNDHAVLSLRNIALPLECEIESDSDSSIDTNVDGSGLLEAFPDDDDDDTTSNALQHRFDELPIHKICYYQSYHDTETTMQNLKREINPWTTTPPGQLNATGNRQDCLGMTPLHILACSTKPTIEMYRLLIEKYPETLITKDKWGDIPFLYVFWCNATTEVLDLLVESYKSLHPEYEFDWSGMLKTLVKRDVPLANIQRLLNTHQACFPDQEYDLQQVILELAAYDTSMSNLYRRGTSIGTFRYLLQISINKRLDILGITKWRLDLENSIGAFRDETERERTTKALYDRLDMYELAKEATSILELATWKHKMDESTPSDNAKSTGSNKRARMDTNIGERQQYRVNCGANIVMRNVLPYLLPK